MAEATFCLAVENLDILLIQYPNIPLRVQRKARELKDKLQSLQNLPSNAVERQSLRSSWYIQLREVAQDVEDVIESFGSTPAGSTRNRRWLSLPALITCSSGILENDATAEIKSISRRLKGIVKTQEGLLFRRSEENGRQFTPTTSEHNHEHVVGMRQDVQWLLDMAILNVRTGLSVAAIVGIGGIGKTTFARLVYNDPAVNQHFHWRAWVFVSSRFSLETIVKLLARELLRRDELPERIESFPLPNLQMLLRQRLAGRRYLIVLDDVCEYADLEALLTIFPNEDIGSRLLITSRNRDVTKQARWVQEMKILNPDDSWQLLLRNAFFRHDDHKCPEHLDRIRRQILTKCHGLPSAIKEVGRLLMERESEREWEHVLQTMDLNVMSNAFELSYQRLPPELKLCFLCIAFFREGAYMRAEKLIQLWTAGGMVRQEEHMEEKAASYLDGLISRYMVKIEDRTKDDRVKNCSVYDFFHKPSIRKAEDEISFEMLREGRDPAAVHKPIHRAIYCTRDWFINSKNPSNYLRSLFFHGGSSFDLDAFNWISYERLNVLDFEGFCLEVFPEAITSLKRLKYLGLRNNFIVQLPESLGCLEKLIVFDISLNFAVIVPDVIWKMESLRHLYMSEIVCRNGLRIDRLKNLRTLAYISVDNWMYERSSLETMTNLRKLGIQELNEESNISNLFESLGRLRNLVCLNLRGFRYISMPSLNEVGCLVNLTQLKIDGLLAVLPDAADFPPNLCYLTLDNTSLDEDPMTVVQKLPKLLHIKLRNAYNGHVMKISKEGFPRLRVMRMGNLSHLRHVYVEDGAMPHLLRWEINGCPYLENRPIQATIMV